MRFTRTLSTAFQVLLNQRTQGLFFIGYLIFEVPRNLKLERVGARRWFAIILITWSAIIAWWQSEFGKADCGFLDKGGRVEQDRENNKT
ncbi:hypothetical protein [Pseudomonas putida]|uniref:hypothetical protein n=1 Tax=Pseudomonas putida TaxID=303 RepID=UPI0023645636|nr:hypothetical protein [Pseudomonas putida]MDD2001958.1 hypothetical protein [Pseudomonas putida]